VKALVALKKDKYSIPQLPVVMIPADSIDEAKGKLALASSQYGKFTEDGVADFMDSLEFDEDLFSEIELPFFDFEEPGKKIDVTAHEREVKNTSKEIDLNEFENFDHQCPKCGFEWNK
jgi:hypothetical protein